MQDSDSTFSLASLQSRLDDLAPGGALTLGMTEVRRLFGVNDVGQGRLENFAHGHHCRIDATPSAVTFRKPAGR